MKTVETVCYEILREITRVNRAYDADNFVVYASPAVADALHGDESHALLNWKYLLVNRSKSNQSRSIFKSILTW
ncbi:hypothetical protein [Vibrio taketomensis]|uniref:hypothetical protein n=1 Tax=Vibrio taketomensis TaxID=2572923 RepID=UPI0038CD6245